MVCVEACNHTPNIKSTEVTFSLIVNNVSVNKVLLTNSNIVPKRSNIVYIIQCCFTAFSQRRFTLTVINVKEPWLNAIKQYCEV